MSSNGLVTLRSGIGVRKDIYDGLMHRLSLGDKWWINGDGELFIQFGATCRPHSMPWLTDDAGSQVAAILDDLHESGLGMLT